MEHYVNIIVSQRLKLAEQDLANKTFEEVLAALICRNRDLTPEELAREHDEILRLYAQSAAAVAHIQEDPDNCLLNKIRSMDLTYEELTLWIQQITDRLLAMEKIGYVDVEGFLSDSFRLELQQLHIARMKNTAADIPRHRLEELLAYSMTVTALLSLREPTAPTHSSLSENGMETACDGTLAMKAVRVLRDKGKLPAYWDEIPDDKIRDLFHLIRNDAALRMSNASLLNVLTEEMVMDYVRDRKEAAADIYALDEEDVKARHLLSIAVLRNMKATGKLPEALKNMDDKSLALMAYTGTEMNFYFNEAAAGHPSKETFLDIACSLLMAVVCGYWSVILLTTPGPRLQKGFGVFLGLSAACDVCQAVDTLLSELFPAGVAETRIGLTVTASATKVRTFAKDLLSRFTAPAAPRAAAVSVSHWDETASEAWMDTEVWEEEIEEDETAFF